MVDVDRLRIYGNRVLLRALSRDEFATQTAGGLYLPPQAEDRQRYRQWEIAAVGDSVRNVMLQPGLRIITSGRFVGEPYTFDGREYRVIAEENIAAYFTGADDYE